MSTRVLRKNTIPDTATYEKMGSNPSRLQTYEHTVSNPLCHRAHWQAATSKVRPQDEYEKKLRLTAVRDKSPHKRIDALKDIVTLLELIHFPQDMLSGDNWGMLCEASFIADDGNDSTIAQEESFWKKIMLAATNRADWAWELAERARVSMNTA